MIYNCKTIGELVEHLQQFHSDTKLLTHSIDPAIGMSDYPTPLVRVKLTEYQQEEEEDFESGITIALYNQKE